MSQGEVEAAFTHMQARLKKANKPQKFLPKLPKWSALSSQQKRSLVGRSAFFMTISWLFMEYYVSRAPQSVSLSEKSKKWAEFRQTVKDHNKSRD